ncbi:MAG: hypothetical protein CMP97_09825 [Gammaproteobacteria bacterium]|jgi:hypothetical protein|nr:hypothetical protein [Gammaproteobacteria bacterium]
MDVAVTNFPEQCYLWGWEAIDASTGATIPVKQGKFSVVGASAALMPTCTQGESIYVEQFI